MNEHFIRNIEIKNFKLFKDFKAEGFGRVNLIGGKNNVGKTAFMEACYLGSYTPDIDYDPFFRLEDENEINSSHIRLAFTILEFHRNSSDFLLLNQDISFKFQNSIFTLNNGIKRQYTDNITVSSREFKEIIINNNSFISIIDVFNSKLINLIFEIKLLNKEDVLNTILYELFQIEKVDVIRDIVMFKQKEHYRPLNEFGDGIKHFLNILLSIYLNNNNIVYLDEIENGIHYSNLDKLWEIILTVSKEQNVQVFATTHSKECIESYARVAKKLGDEEITFIELGKNKKNEIKAITMDYERFQDEIDNTNEVRGW